jgi:hypothetical protein
MPLIHADVPHARTTPRVLEPLFLLSNASVFALHAPALLSARVELDGVEPLGGVKQPLVFISWHRYNFAATAALRS